MSKPLTIEELKALQIGDWVWIIDRANSSIGKYYKIVDGTAYAPRVNFLRVISGMFDYAFRFFDYGATWTAYKNREQAEGKDEYMVERIEKAYEHNVTECKRCMNIVDMKHQFAMESMKEHIRKETAKEILTTLKDWCNRNTPIAVDIQELAEKYGVEVDE